MSADDAVTLASCDADVVEIAALRGHAGELERVALGRGVQLPALGEVTIASDTIALAVRPDRWLILTAPTAPGAAAAAWEAVCPGIATVVDLSSALAALHLAGRIAPEVLARGCRLDLDPEVFPAQRAAATSMAQVSVVLAALHSGWLLLTPSTTARHFREWLASTAQPFGASELGERSVFERLA